MAPGALERQGERHRICLGHATNQTVEFRPAGRTAVHAHRARGLASYSSGFVPQTRVPSEFLLRLQNRFAAWNLPAEFATKIESQCIWVTYEKGAIIFARGSIAHVMFWLAKGLVKVRFPLGSSDRSLAFVCRSGEPLGILCSGDNKGCRRYVLEAQALTKCTVGLIGRSQVAELFAEFDRDCAIEQFENSTCSVIFKRKSAFVGLSFRRRLQIVLKDLAERIGVRDDRGVLIPPELSHEDLAEMIGSSRAMVSKLVTEMTEDRLLARSARQLILLDKGRLVSPLPWRKPCSKFSTGGITGVSSVRE